MYHVNRFASEYQNTIASATGDRARQSHPSCAAESTNSADAPRTNTIASERLIRPAGNSRIDVRGLRLSNSASTSRLKPMAALRAATMQATIQTTRIHSKPTYRAARSAPTSANGSAKTEWLKRTNDA